MNRKSTPIPEPIAQLQRQLDQFRSTQRRRTKLPESLWQAAVELARQHGVYPVAHPLRLDYMGLKKRLGGVTKPPTEGNQAGIRRTDRSAIRRRWRSASSSSSLARQQDAHPVEGSRATGLDEPAARLAGSGRMIQITRADARAGGDRAGRRTERALIRWRGFARTSSPKIHSPDACSCFAAAAGRRSGCSAMTARDTGWRRSGFPKDDSYGGRKPASRPSRWKPMRRSC